MEELTLFGILYVLFVVLDSESGKKSVIWLSNIPN